jgi:hypothetical protein
LADVCDDLLLIETMVCDARLPVPRLEDETTSVNQALRGLAHRPSPSHLAPALNRVGFDHVYAAADPPDHPDYRLSGSAIWIRRARARRYGTIFLASRTPLAKPGLASLLG